MIELNKLRSEKNKIASALKKRGLKEIDNELSKVIELDDQRKNLKSELDKILEESNIIAKDIGVKIKNGEKDSVDELKKRSGELKEKSKSVSEELKSIEIKLRNMLCNIPNIPDEIVPEGNSDTDNIIVSSKELKISNEIKYKPHWDLIKDFNLIDFDTGNKITGAGFPVYIEKGAKLQRALINYFLDEANSNGYSEVQPPILINEESGFGTGQLPDKEGQMYKIEDENLYMIPTAEVPITNMYRKKIIDKGTLPIKNVAYTPCFRKEAGSWGSHVRGLNRLHQFDKVEIVQIENESGSDKALEEMCNYVESLVKSLEISYRKLLLCAGDLGFTASVTYDFEVYAPGQDRWLECSSVSNFRTYQANRMNLKVRDGKNKFLANTLNGSALALPRIVAAILETHQNGNEINIPKALHKYTGFKKINL
ncbi:MAG: serine--tRNA ligase [Rhodothermaeota bacterium MED-G19]|nr:MAG: serine--tRNA ligase [Rhodothermaeota bacterium MED-G19]